MQSAVESYILHNARSLDQVRKSSCIFLKCFCLQCKMALLGFLQEKELERRSSATETKEAVPDHPQAVASWWSLVGPRFSGRGFVGLADNAARPS